jgi:tetratricopeptide (TPR) repeat protein
MTAAETSSPRPAPRRRRLWLWVPLALVVLAVGAAGLWFYVLGPRPPDVDVAEAGPGVAQDIAEGRQSVRLFPFSAEAWGNLGMILHLYEYFPEAGECYARAAQLAPRNPRWPYLQGVIQMRFDLERSLPLLKRAVELGGDVPTPRLLYGEALLLGGRPEAAEGPFRSVLEQQPDNARALLGLGRVAFGRGDLAASRDFLERSAALAPRVRTTQALLGQVYLQGGDAAAAEMKRALAATLPENPAWPDPYRKINLQELRGEAAAVFQSTALREQKKEKEAIDLLQRALVRHPQSATLQRALGRTYVALGDYAAADKAYQEAVRLRPDSVESQYERGRLLEHQGNPRAAAESFRQALRLRPHYGEAHYHLGQCLEAQGDTAGAIKAYREAVHYQPELAAAHQALGALLAMSSQYAEAQEVLERALKLDPSHEKTRQWLEIVRRGASSSAAGDKRP